MRTSGCSLLAGLYLFCTVGPVMVAQRADEKFEAIKGKRARGETTSPEEREYVQGVLAQRRAKSESPAAAEYARENPPRETTGLVPLPDLAGRAYRGESGGLYPEGRNTPPGAHSAAGLKRARSIVPLDPEGRPSAEGRIVLLTTGMSNTTQESQAFLQLVAKDSTVNPRLTCVDGAQGGQAAGITAQPNANYWIVNANRLKAAGVAPAQVQVVWLKQANPRPTEAFPIAAKKLQADLVATLHNLHQKFPNLKIVYLSSRTYGGYASTPLNPEPHAYESGFAVKWLIADQIAGSGALNYDASRGVVRAPWVAWGPYLWADGTAGRVDGFTWNRSDFGPDGTHPSESGRQKVAEHLLKFLKNEPTAKPWFLQKP